MRTAVVGTVVACVLAAVAAPATADVKAGVDAWKQGDYARAVAEWRPLATAGDADAQFNLGQAYKLGRGVPVDMPMALSWFQKASAQGHLRASDNYGLLLFQQGEQQKAIPYIRKSAERGEPRAMYILGTAMFNGDLAPKDWVGAYALMTRAAAAGLQQATNSLAIMDKYISEGDRQKGLALATDMDRRSAALANGVPIDGAPSQAASAPAARPAPAPQVAAQPPHARDLPHKIATAPVPPSVAAADAPPPPKAPPKPLPEKAPAVAAVTPAKHPAPVAAASASPKTEPKAAASQPGKIIMPPSVASDPAIAGEGDWRIQLGAFRDEGRARALWAVALPKVQGLSAYTPFLSKDGGVTRLQGGPLRSEGAATQLCGRVKAAGFDCIVKHR